MAATAITSTLLTANTWATFPTTQASDASDGADISLPRPDGKLLIYCQNADAVNAETVVIKGGDGPMAMGDLSLSLAASGVKVISIDSGRYVKDNGKIHLTGSADVKLAAIFLP